MLSEHTLDQLRALRLDGMVHAIEEQATSTAAADGDRSRCSTACRALQSLATPSADGVQPEHPSQWWYWSGQLRGASGHRYGFQLAHFTAEAVRERGLIKRLRVFVVAGRIFATERHHRRRRARGGHERGSQLRGAGAAGCGAHAGVARRTRPAVGHAEAHAFMAHLVHDDAVLAVGVLPIHVAVAHHAEYVGRAFGLEGLRKSFIHLHCLLSLDSPAGENGINSKTKNVRRSGRFRTRRSSATPGWGA